MSGAMRCVSSTSASSGSLLRGGGSSRRRLATAAQRAALIYQHEAQGADKAITNAIDTHVQAEQTRRDDDEDGPADVLVPAG